MNWLNEIKNVKPESVYSQYGEESYLNFIFQNIGTTNKYFVDIGANNGIHLSNTRLFFNEGWDGLMIDGAYDNHPVKKHFITKDNILGLLESYNVPKDFDLLSLDIDGVDYYVLKEILSVYKPRVIISEFNSELPKDWSVSIEYDEDFKFAANIYYGYSFRAGLKLAEFFGYRVVHQNSNLNMYYVLKSELPELDIDVHYEQFKWWGGTTDKKWVEV